MITPKHIWIFRFIKITCRKCGKCERIYERLWDEINDDDFDYDKELKANKIMAEEA